VECVRSCVSGAVAVAGNGLGPVLFIGIALLVVAAVVFSVHLHERRRTELRDFMEEGFRAFEALRTDGA